MSKETKTREEIYDAQIAPLMTQIIAICKANKIPMIANYNLDHDGDGLQCTTLIAAGVSIEDVAGLLGNTTTVALRAYVDLTAQSERLKEAARRG